MPLTVAGPGHYAAYGYELPLAGKWQVEVIVRLTTSTRSASRGASTPASQPDTHQRKATSMHTPRRMVALAVAGTALPRR